MHGMHGLVVAQRRLFGKYTPPPPSVMTIHVQIGSHKKPVFSKLIPINKFSYMWMCEI